LIRNLAGRLDQQWLGMKAKVVVARKIAVILHCIWVMVIALSGDGPRRYRQVPGPGLLGWRCPRWDGRSDIIMRRLGDLGKDHDPSAGISRKLTTSRN
jgi:hypothetical protein